MLLSKCSMTVSGCHSARSDSGVAESNHETLRLMRRVTGMGGAKIADSRKNDKGGFTPFITPNNFKHPEPVGEPAEPWRRGRAGSATLA